LRRFLDRLYAASGALAAVCLGSIALVMLAQAGMREFGYLLRGADDIVSWLCAAAAFLALGHTFRRGELVRVGLLIEHLPPRARRRFALGFTALFAATWPGRWRVRLRAGSSRRWRRADPIDLDPQVTSCRRAVFLVAVLDEATGCGGNRIPGRRGRAPRGKDFRNV
jgi:hypothetical protein